KYSALREFIRWGQRQGLFTSDPLFLIDRPKKPEHLPRPLRHEDIAAIMALGLSPIESTVRALLYYTGLRVTPLARLRVKDCSFAEVAFEDGTRFPGSVRALGKGNKEVVIPIHPALKETLFSWVVEHTDMQPGTWLLRQRSGRPYSRRMIE